MEQLAHTSGERISGPSQYNNVVHQPMHKQRQIVWYREPIKFELTVTDNSGASAKDTMQVTVNAAPINQSPTAKAGSDISHYSCQLTVLHCQEPVTILMDRSHHINGERSLVRLNTISFHQLKRKHQ